MPPLLITAIPSYSYLINQDWHIQLRMSNFVSNERTPAKTTMKTATSALWSVLKLPLISTWWYPGLRTLSALSTICNGKPTDGFLLKRISNAELWCFLCCYPEQTVNQAVNLPLIWDVVLPMWSHINTIYTLIQAHFCVFNDYIAVLSAFKLVIPLYFNGCFKDTEVIHYIDVTMGAVASQFTSVSIVFSPVYSGIVQRKH